MVATARPVKGVAYGRIDPWPPSWLGLPVGAPATPVASQPPTATPPTSTPRHRLGQLYAADAVRDGHVQARLPLDLSCRAGALRDAAADAACVRVLSLSPARRASSPSQRPPSEPDQPVDPGHRRPVHRGSAVPRCPDSAVLARCHRDVPSRLSLEVREAQDLALRNAFRPGGSAPTLGKMRRVLLGILATLELGGRRTARSSRTTPCGGSRSRRRRSGYRRCGRRRPATRDDHRHRRHGVNLIPDLEGALVPGYDFIDNDLESQDVDSHGTRVASVIAARGNNGVGMAGHCWKCRIMPVRISENGTTTPAGIATGIVYAVDHGAKIINVSFAHRNYDSGEADAVRYAAERGAIVVASAETRATTSRSIQPRTRACSRSARRTWRTRSTGRAAGLGCC